MTSTHWVIYLSVLLALLTPFLVIKISKGSGERQLKRWEKQRKKNAEEQNIPYTPLPEYYANQIRERRWRESTGDDGGGEGWGDDGGD